jgi:hypothetical protein
MDTFGSDFESILYSLQKLPTRKNQDNGRILQNY